MPDEKREWIFRCSKCGGNVNVQAETKEQAEAWLKRQTGYCPAGGSHVELSFESYFDFLEESPTVHKIPSDEEKFRTIVQKMLDLLKNGTAVLTAGNIGIPTINMVRDAKHCGFGSFISYVDRKGEPLGERRSVNFDAGGAMNRGVKPMYGWTRFWGDVDAWGYPFEEAIAQLSDILENGYSPPKD